MCYKSSSFTNGFGNWFLRAKMCRSKSGSCSYLEVAKHRPNLCTAHTMGWMDRQGNQEPPLQKSTQIWGHQVDYRHPRKRCSDVLEAVTRNSKCKASSLQSGLDPMFQVTGIWGWFCFLITLLPITSPWDMLVVLVTNIYINHTYVYIYIKWTSSTNQSLPGKALKKNKSVSQAEPIPLGLPLESLQQELECTQQHHHQGTMGCHSAEARMNMRYGQEEHSHYRSVW